MAFPIRTVFLSGGLAAIVAGGLAAPSLFPAAFAAEPQKHVLDTAGEIFSKPFDLDRLKKFDITTDDSVSTTVQRTATVQKIGFGKRTMVSIVTTPSGTYSSDAIVSPNVRYPGIDVTPNALCDCSHSRIRFGVATSDYGTWTWSYVSRGSFIYSSSSFKRAPVPRR